MTKKVDKYGSTQPGPPASTHTKKPVTLPTPLAALNANYQKNNVIKQLKDIYVNEVCYRCLY